MSLPNPSNLAFLPNGEADPSRAINLALSQISQLLATGGLSPGYISSLNGIVQSAIADNDLTLILDVSASAVKSLNMAYLAGYVSSKIGVFGALGSGHKSGLVPDPGATAGTTRYLREDGTWVAPAGGGGTPTALVNGDGTPNGTGTWFVDAAGRPWGQSSDGVIRLMRSPSGAAAQLRVGGIYVTAAITGSDEFLLFQQLAYLQFQTNAGTSYVMKDGGMGVNTNSPAAQFHAVNSSVSQPVAIFDLASGQTGVAILLRNQTGVVKFTLYADGGIEAPYFILPSSGGPRFKYTANNDGSLAYNSL